MRNCYILILLLICSSCYNEIDLDKYRDQEGKDLLTLNSMINPDSIITIFATKTAYYTDEETTHRFEYVKDLNIELAINDKISQTMNMQVDTTGRIYYTSNLRANAGDKIEYTTTYKSKQVSGYDYCPHKVEIESVATRVEGPMIYDSNNSYIIHYDIKFNDPQKKSNYYYLEIQDTVGGMITRVSSYIYEDEFVFQQLQNQIQALVPAWEFPVITGGSGLPFSDYAIDGKSYTLKIKEIYPAYFAINKQMLGREIKLFAISENYYKYLVSILCNMNNIDFNGIINIGMSNPIAIYSNINGGVGIVGAYNLDAQHINLYDQFSQLGKK